MQNRGVPLSSPFPVSMLSTLRCLIHPYVYFDGDAVTCFVINRCCQCDPNRAHSAAISLGTGSISLLAFQDKKLQQSHSSQGTGITSRGDAEFLMHEVTAIHTELSLAKFKIPWMPVCVRVH